MQEIILEIKFIHNKYTNKNQMKLNLIILIILK